MPQIQEKINAFNQKTYNIVVNDYTRKLMGINEKIKAINLSEVQTVLQITQFPVQLVMDKDFHFTTFFQRVLDVRKENRPFIDELITKYEESEDYKILNDLYADWRDIINEIGENINKEYSQFLSELSKEIYTEEEKISLEKEQAELAEMEKMLDEI